MVKLQRPSVPSKPPLEEAGTLDRLNPSFAKLERGEKATEKLMYIIMHF